VGVVRLLVEIRTAFRAQAGAVRAALDLGRQGEREPDQRWAKLSELRFD